MFNELKDVEAPRATAACLTRARPIEARHTIFRRAVRHSTHEAGSREKMRMATAAPNQGLPLFYNSIEPLNLEQHGKMKVRGISSVAEIGRTHGVRLTADEFRLVQRYCRSVFSDGAPPVPIALMGLNDGVRVFLDENC